MTVVLDDNDKLQFGQLLLNRGVHPFYVDMDFQSFCQALEGWTIEDVVVTADEYAVEGKKKWDTTLDFVTTYNSCKITIGFMSDPNDRAKFSDLVSIETDDVILADGRALAEISICEFEKVFSCKLIRDDIPDRQIKGMGHWSCEDGLASMLVFEYDGLVTGIGVYRDPERGD